MAATQPCLIGPSVPLRPSQSISWAFKSESALFGSLWVS